MPAQGAWPNKGVRVVVGFDPGGTTEVMTHMLAQGLAEALGRTVIVDDKPGASGNIDADDMVQAAPDGCWTGRADLVPADSRPQRSSSEAVKELVNRAYEASLAEGIWFERRWLHAHFACGYRTKLMKASLDKSAPILNHC